MVKWAGVSKLSPLPLSPPSSEFCNDENNSVIRSAMDALRNSKKVSLLAVAILFLFTFFNLILNAPRNWSVLVGNKFPVRFLQFCSYSYAAKKGKASLIDSYSSSLDINHWICRSTVCEKFCLFVFVYSKKFFCKEFNRLVILVVNSWSLFYTLRVHV